MASVFTLYVWEGRARVGVRVRYDPLVISQEQ